MRSFQGRAGHCNRLVASSETQVHGRNGRQARDRLLVAKRHINRVCQAGVRSASVTQWVEERLALALAGR